MTSIDLSVRSRTSPPAGSGKSSKAAKKETRTGGIEIDRYFTRAGVDVYDTCEWEIRTAAISSETGTSVFEQKEVEMPKFWSQMATNVVVSKYFRGHLNTPERETSVRQLIGRVVRTITQWGREGGYFATEADGDTFRDELTHILLYQMAAFNSPVWFNVGIEEKPAVLGVLHQLRAGHHGLDPRTGEDRGDAVQVRVGNGVEPFQHPQLARAPGRRRHRVRPGLVHARL